MVEETNAIQNLESLGLSPAESKVYYTLIKLGNSRVGKIISMLDISPSNVHEALEKLLKRGMVSNMIKNGIKEYSAADPRTLKQLLQSEKQVLEKKESNLNDLLPLLASIRGSPKVNQNAEVYVGLNGIKSAFRRLLTPVSKKSDYLFFYKPDSKDIEKVHEFFSKMDKEDYYSALKTRAIFSSEYKHPFSKRKNKIDARFTDAPIPSNIDIFNEKVLIISWADKPVGYLIESKEISEMFRLLFESVWKISKK